MVKALLALLLAVVTPSFAQTIFPLQTFTGAATGTIIPLAASYSAGTITLTATALTTVTFAVQGSADGGNTYWPLAISNVASPTTLPASSVTTTASGLYQVNLSGLTHVKFVVSGTFTATAVNLVLSASNGAVASSRLPRVVASGRVSLQQATLGLTTVFTTPAAIGNYEVCAGAVVTTGGSAGATLQALFAYTNEQGSVKGPNLGGSAIASTVAGADTSSFGPSTSACQTVNAKASTNIQVGFTVGGAPATIPIYTYWWVVTQKQ